jgi:hypothetical protein
LLYKEIAIAIVIAITIVLAIVIAMVGDWLVFVLVEYQSIVTVNVVASVEDCDCGGGGGGGDWLTGILGVCG